MSRLTDFRLCARAPRTEIRPGFDLTGWKEDITLSSTKISANASARRPKIKTRNQKPQNDVFKRLRAASRRQNENQRLLRFSKTTRPRFFYYNRSRRRRKRPARGSTQKIADFLRFTPFSALGSRRFFRFSTVFSFSRPSFSFLNVFDRKTLKKLKTPRIPTFRAPPSVFLSFFLKTLFSPNLATAIFSPFFLQVARARVVFFIVGAIIRNESFRRSLRRGD